MNNELSDASERLDDLYAQLKSGADDNEVGWHEFSQCVQEFTRLLFRYKRMNDKNEQADQEVVS